MNHKGIEVGKTYVYVTPDNKIINEMIVVGVYKRPLFYLVEADKYVPEFMTVEQYESIGVEVITVNSSYLREVE